MASSMEGLMDAGMDVFTDGPMNAAIDMTIFCPSVGEASIIYGRNIAHGAVYGPMVSVMVYGMVDHCRRRSRPLSPMNSTNGSVRVDPTRPRARPWSTMDSTMAASMYCPTIVKHPPNPMYTAIAHDAHILKCTGTNTMFGSSSTRSSNNVGRRKSQPSQTKWPGFSTPILR